MSLRRSSAALFVFVAFALFASTASAQQVVISQVYGGGGNGGATYTNDFVELFNAGTSTVNLTGWSVQYTSSAGTTWTNRTNLSGSIQAGHYYLVQEAAGTGGTLALPSPDATGSIGMSATAGKVALVNTTTALSGGCPTGASIIDFVGFGTAATCSETAPTATLANATAAIRKAGGCTDSGNNSTDFAVAAPVPRNSASPLNDCAVSPFVASVGVPVPGTYIVGQNVDLTVNFNEGVFVSGGAPRIAVTLDTGGIVYADYSAGSGTTALVFRHTIAVGEEDATGISLASDFDTNGGTITDASGNPAATALNSAGDTTSVLVDGIAPAVIGSIVPVDGLYKAGDNLDFTVTYGESVLVSGGTPSLALTLNTGGTVAAPLISGSGTTTLIFRYTVGMGQEDADGISVAGSISLNTATIRDAAGNNAATVVVFGPTSGVLVDSIAPTVQSITRASANPTNASTVTYTAAFSENVTGVDAGDFTLITAGTAGTIASVSPVDAKTYSVTVNAISGNGTLELDLNGSGTGITDAAGNAIAAGFSGEIYTIDTTAPTVTSVGVPAAATYTIGQNLDFTVNFSEAAAKTGAPRLTLALNSGTVYADYFAGDGTSAFVFRYTVGAGNSDPDGISVGAAIDLNGGTIRDIAGNDAVLTLASVGSTTGVLVDATAPSVLAVTAASPTLTSAASVSFTVTFTAAVTGVDISDFSLTTTGITGASITGVSGGGTTYTVTVNSGSGDGTLRLDVLDDDTILNATSIPLTGPFTTGDVYTIDKTAPIASVMRAAPATAITNAASVTFAVTFTESVSGVDAADFVLNTVGVSGPSITSATGSGAVYSVVVATGSGDGSILLGLAASPSITDAAGNNVGASPIGESYTIDKTVPTVTITRASGDPSSAATVDFTVTFSETVTGVATGVFGVNAPALTGTSIAGISGTGPYTVTVNTGTGNGALGLDLTNGAAVLDAAGNATANTTGQTYTMQGTPAAPGGVTATAGDAHVQLTWTAATDATNYDVKRSTTSGGPYTAVASSLAILTYDDTTAANGTTYYYVITANGLRGATNSVQVSATPAGAATPGGVVISQIYGAGSNSGAAYQHDYVELFNSGTSAVDVTGWSIQYQSSAGTTWSVSTIASGSVAAGHYFLVREASNSSTLVGTALPAPDAIPAVATNFSATVGKIALVKNATALTCSTTATCLPNANIADLVGYGSPSNLVAEGNAPAPSPSAINGIFRAGSGCTDTNNNAADFTAAAASPRNSASAANLCGGGSGNNAPTITAPANPITTVAQNAAPFTVNLTGNDDFGAYTWSATPVAGISTVIVSAGQGTATATFTVTLTTGFAGTASFTASLNDGVNPATMQTVNIAVTPTGPVATVVVSQVYGGGGASAGATYKNDYVELFNKGDVTADLSGYSIQYASGDGGSAPDFITSNVFALPAGTTIAAGHYLLVQTGDPGTAGADFPVTADLTATLNLGAGSGKIALANISTALNCGSATPCVLPDSRIADLVSYGVSSNAEGGTSVNNHVALNNTQAAVRKFGGCQDTNNNNNDFDVVTAPTPRNSASAANLCSAPNAAPTITAPASPITTVAQDSAAFTVTLSGNDDKGIYSWSATPGLGVATVSVSAGQSTGSVTYTVALQAGFYGNATFTASLSDTINPAVTQAVTISVTPTAGVDNPPLITPPPNPIATVAQNAPPFTVDVSGNDDRSIYTWSATPGTGIASVTVLSGQGTSTVTYNVTLNVGFAGTATFTTSLSDGVNPTVSRAVYIKVTVSGPHLVISQVYGGGGNSGATYKNDFVELFNPTTYSIDVGAWTVQYASFGGDFTQFQPLGGVIAPGEYFLIALGGGTTGLTLPAANITGSINMGGGAGKIALVSNGDLLTGCSDSDVIDLVGYGSTSSTPSCYEGSTYASANGITTGQSLFRLNNGNTDTDQNGADFYIGTVNPRRTTPITEIGPAVVSTDPRATDVEAPRDANIVVNFSEPVDLATGWYNIICGSGLHNSATVASTFGGKTWVIVPNVNFVPAETCTVTVFKDFVHDTDLDDSAPNTDTLSANFTWTFTVATGAAAPYPADVHLMMGNPSAAVPSISVPNNYLMMKPEYAESYNRDRGTPNWVSWHLSDEWIGTLSRADTFRADPAVSPDWYRVLGSDYSGSGFDRGHMTPNADRDNPASVPINQATFLMSNMLPQAPDNNQGPWAAFEGYLRTLLPANELYIVSGGAGTGGTGSNGFASTVANGHVTVPASTWKVVLVLPKLSGDDVARVTTTTRTIAINIPNIQGIKTIPYSNYITTVDAVEALTGYDFFPNVQDDVEAVIEAGRDGVNPPLPAAISAVAGTPQSAPAGTQFPTALQAKVVDGAGSPIAGVSVTFTAPVSGASGTFASLATVVTDAAGIATAPPFTANILTGSYVVMATVGTHTAPFQMTNTCSPMAGTVMVTIPASVCALSTNNVAAVPAGLGPYVWQITNGTITSGQGTEAVRFTAGASGTVTLSVSTSTASGCPAQTGSGSSAIAPAPRATLPSSLRTCPGNPVAIVVTLTGTAPFDMVWSDGFRQSSPTNTATRQVAPSDATAYRIVSVSDASCTTGAPSNTVQVAVTGPPAFAAVPHDVKIHAGEQIRLGVIVRPTSALQWFKGTVGDESHPVGAGDSFMTPPLYETTRYWVKAIGLCDTATNSPQIVVVIDQSQRRRAVGHH